MAVAVLPVVLKTWPLPVRLPQQAKRSMTAFPARDLDLAVEMTGTVTVTMVNGDQRSAARASRSTLPRAWPHLALEKKHPIVAATIVAEIEMIDMIVVGSGVITGTETHDTTPIQIQMQRATTAAAGITGMAEAREM
jgi:hypothetical protein